jgi:hypothetical protein
VARREFTVFSLSFLDCICCGFGAVILLFVLMNAKASSSREELTKDLRGEVSKIEIEILRLEKEKVLARNALDEVVEELVETQGLSREVLDQIKQSEEELADQKGQTLARKEHVNQLKTDLLSLEEGIKRLKAGAESEEPGDAALAFFGDGSRQYLTGLQVGGDRTLILVDESASMLADRVIDILRIRNLPETEQGSAPKWVQTRRSVDWILSQLPMQDRFHIATFSESTRSLLSGQSGWWDGADPAIRKQASEALQEVIPAGGTSLHNAFAYAAALSPPPDNILLLTDGLPTMAESPPAVRKTVSSNRREALFRDATSKLPGGVPVNTLLFYMEGDPLAAVSYWRLAVQTQGSFLTVTEDWP